MSIEKHWLISTKVWRCSKPRDAGSLQMQQWFGRPASTQYLQTLCRWPLLQSNQIKNIKSGRWAKNISNAERPSTKHLLPKCHQMRSKDQLKTKATRINKKRNNDQFLSVSHTPVIQVWKFYVQLYDFVAVQSPYSNDVVYAYNLQNILTANIIAFGLFLLSKSNRSFGSMKW